MDGFRNFAESTLASGITSGATSLTVASGDGAARMPAVPFNATLWNKTDYAKASLDPDREIVRVTARSTDTLTIVRGQEGTTGVAHNTGGKTYGIAAGATALTLARIPLTKRLVTTATKTLNITLSDVSGMVHDLVAGATYAFELKLHYHEAGGGIHFALAGTATVTAFISNGLYDNTVGVTFIGQSTTLGDIIDQATLTIAADSLIIFEGHIVVNAAGTLKLQFAQNTPHASASTCLAGSTFTLTPSES